MRISSNKVKSIKQFFKQELKDIYPNEEIQGFIFLAFEHYLGYSKTDVLLNDEKTVSESELLKFNFLVKDLKKQKPIQYILGKTEFYGLNFNVAPGVLIPRPETEELVEMIIKENKNRNQLDILDIGTGSGCIAITLKKYLPKASVFAFDISKDALNIAQGNALLNDVEVNFEQVDILNYNEFSHGIMLDIIVSNPPYVLKSEKELMQKNVLDHEPHLALFVNDNEPFLFYKAIGAYAKEYLKDNGKLYFEINEKYDHEIIAVFKEMGFSNCSVIKDLNGKNRFLRVNK